MAIKEQNLPVGTEAADGMYFRTVGSGGESQKTPFDTIKAGVAMEVDTALSDNSTNPVQNMAIKAALDAEETARNAAISEAVAAEAQAREAADEELNQSKADTDGNYPDMTVGNADQLISSIYTEDQIPYNFRQSGGGLSIGDREIDKIVGGTIAWNQLCPELNASNWNGSNTTRTYSDGVATIVPSALYGIISKSGLHSGVNVVSPSHKYLMMADVKAVSDTTLAFVIEDNTNFTYVKEFTATTSWAKYSGIINIASTSVANGIYYGIRSNYSGDLAEYQLKNFVMFDLTQMFGSAIADYIYSLEQATAGAGVAYFRKLFPEPYYAYNAGELMSVQAASHDMVGFNQWDEEWAIGVYSNGALIINDSYAYLCSKNHIKVIPGATYCFNAPVSTIYTYCYDADGNYLSKGLAFVNNTATIPDDVYEITFAVSKTAYGTTYNNDICINLSHNGSRNGEYEPYEKHSYELDGNLTLRGIPKLDASNNLYYDGDTYESDGTVTRKYGVVDLGTLNWTNYKNGGFQSEVIPAKNATGAKKPNVVMSKYYSPEYNTTTLASGMMTISVNRILIVDSNFTTDATAFKTAMSGVYLVYELATPTTETATAYTNPQTVSDWGTEEYVDAAVQEGDRDVAVPVGHVTDYLANLRDKLQNLPDAANADGTYLIQQTSGQMALLAYTPGVNVPAAPTTDGTYTLQAVVSGGVATYSWVSS